MTTRQPVNILDDILGPGGPLPAAASAGLPIYHIPLSRLVDNTYQTRQRNDPDHVLKIAKSVLALAPSLPETKGLQQVPIARVMRWGDTAPVPARTYDNPAALRRLAEDDQYVVEMAFGHSRRLAFEVLAYGVAGVFPELAGAEQIALNGAEFDAAHYGAMPVILLPLDDRTMWQQAIIENAARQDISAIEEAHSLRRAVAELGLTVEEAGRTLGKSRSAASNLLRLLDLPEEYQQAIINGVLSETHGRTVLALKPAMHLLRTPIADLGAMTRKELENYVAHVIAACQPLAPGPRTDYRFTHGGIHNDIFTRQYDPPAWPLDWQPDPADGIVGPCAGCQWSATFAGDPGPRCTHVTTFAGRRTCYDLKTQQWQAKQIELQRQAIEARQAAVAATSAAGAHTSTAPAHTSNGTAAAHHVSQETPAAPDAPVYTPTNSTEVTWFTTNKSYWGQAPAVLLDKGLCSAGKCKCFVLAYKATLDGSEIRPDADSAPNMCYGCTSPQRLARRKQELEHGDMAAKRAAIKSENAACEELLRDAFYRLTAQDLWHNSQFMRHLLKAGSLSNGLGQRNIEGLDALEIQDWIWRRVARERCCNWSQFTVDGETQHWSMDKVHTWLREIAAGFARAPGGVWDELRTVEEQPAKAFHIDL